MANTKYHRQQKQTQNSGIDPLWMLLCAIFALALGLIALPWIIIGFVTQRILAQWLPWKLSFLLWFICLFVGAFFLYHSYQHGLQLMMNRELDNYIFAAKHYQTDFSHWPLQSLWADTLPVWKSTWQGIGIAGFAAELFTNAHNDTAKMLRQNEQQRQQRAQRSQRRARKRTSKPQYVPDEVNGMMVMGIAIDDYTDKEV